MALRSLLVTERVGVRRYGKLLRRVPPWLAVAFVPLLVAAYIGAASGIDKSRGQPERRNGQYVINVHGSYLVVSEAAYHREKALQLRVFSFIPAVFYGL